MMYSRLVRPVAVALPALTIAAMALAACTSSGSDAAPATTTASASAGTNPTASPTQVAPSQTPTDAPGSQLPSSISVSVPTGTKAPYPTPGKEPRPKANQVKVLESVPGSSSSSCYPVKNDRDVRSGSVAAGNFQDARAQFHTDYGKTEVTELNMYLIPQHAGHLKRATVVVAPLGAGKSTSVVSNSVEPADAYRYFGFQVPVAHPGMYKLTFSSGPDTGCFLVRFSR